jgi:hypothetical protein
MADLTSPKRIALSKPFACGCTKLRTMLVVGDKSKVRQAWTHTTGHDQNPRDKNCRWYACYDHQLAFMNKEQYTLTEKSTTMARTLSDVWTRLGSYQCHKGLLGRRMRGPPTCSYDQDESLMVSFIDFTRCFGSRHTATFIPHSADRVMCILLSKNENGVATPVETTTPLLTQGDSDSRWWPLTPCPTRGEAHFLRLSHDARQVRELQHPQPRIVHLFHPLHLHLHPSFHFTSTSTLPSSAPLVLW